jgi:hypothetical protein
VCEREGVARMGADRACSICASRGGAQPIMVACLHPPLETVLVSYSAHFDPIWKFAVYIRDSLTPPLLNPQRNTKIPTFHMGG